MHYRDGQSSGGHPRGDQRQSVFGRRGGRNGYRPAPKDLSGAAGAAQWGEHRLLGRAVEQLDRVLSCKVCPGGSDYIVTVYVRDRQGQVDDELRLAVTEKLDILTLAGCFIDVQEAKKQPVQLVCSAQILAGADSATVRSALENQLKELCSARVIGGGLHPSALGGAGCKRTACAAPRRCMRRVKRAA